MALDIYGKQNWDYITRAVARGHYRTPMEAINAVRQAVGLDDLPDDTAGSTIDGEVRAVGADGLGVLDMPGFMWRKRQHEGKWK